MGSVAANLSWGRSLGVYLADGHLTVTEMAATPAGRKVLSTERLAVGEGGPGQTLRAWIEAHLKRRQRRSVSVAVGLAAEQTYFTTQTYSETSQEVPTAAALLASSGSASLDPSNSTADYVKSKLNRTTIYRVAACRRGVAEELYQALKNTGVINVRLEPAPGAVLEAADRTAKPPRAWKALVRVLLGEGGGLSMLVVGGKPVLWRRFAVTAGQEALSIASAVRHVEVHALNNLGFRGTAGLFVQGKIEPALVEELRDMLSMEVQVAPGAPPDDALFSLAMALSARRKDGDHIDLFRAIRPPPSLSQLFPRQMAAGLVLAAVAVGLILYNALSEVEGECQTVHDQNASYKWAEGLTTDAIRAERKSLSDEVAQIQNFVGTRLIWSNYLSDLPTRLPANACLQSMSGSFEFKSSTKNATQKTNRSLVVSGMARFTDRGSAPKEIDAFLESLRGADSLRKTFPQVNLAEIKWKREPGADIALFTIIATPIEKVAGKEDGEDGGKGKAPAAHG